MQLWRYKSIFVAFAILHYGPCDCENGGEQYGDTWASLVLRPGGNMAIWAQLFPPPVGNRGGHGNMELGTGEAGIGGVGNERNRNWGTEKKKRCTCDLGIRNQRVHSCTKDIENNLGQMDTAK
jgi:hypothetical protein